MDANHLVLGHSFGLMEMIFRNDGTLHPGPGPNWNLVVWPPPPIPPSAAPYVGSNVIQIGSTFRIGALDGAHLCIGHSGGQTEQVYRSDGTLHPGPSTSWNPWSMHGGALGSPGGVVLGDNMIQISEWRICMYDIAHLAVTHASGTTAVIYKYDGAKFPGPISDHNCE